MNRVKSVPTSMPVVIIRPILNRALAPALLPKRRGNTPSTVANVVIKIGRSLSEDASRIASLASPVFSISLLANSTIKMPCLLINPISVNRPMWV